MESEMSVSRETSDQLKEIRDRVQIIKEPTTARTIGTFKKFVVGERVLIDISDCKVMGTVIAIIPGGKVRVSYVGSLNNGTKTITRNMSKRRVKKIAPDGPQ